MQKSIYSKFHLHKVQEESNLIYRNFRIVVSSGKEELTKKCVRELSGVLEMFYVLIELVITQVHTLSKLMELF